MSISRIRKGDEVIAISGVGAGKTGRVLAVDPVKGRAIVEGLNLVKKSVRRSPDNAQGGFVPKEAPIALSNLMPYDPTLKKGVRVSRVRTDGHSVRKSKSSNHVFDS